MEGWMLIVGLVALVLVSAVAIVAMRIVQNHSAESQRTLSAAQNAGLEKLFGERHHWQQNSLESQMVKQQAETQRIQAELIETLTQKVMAYTAEGRDAVMNAERLKILERDLLDARENHEAIVSALKMGTEAGQAQARPRVASVAEKDGIVSATFGDPNDV